MASKDAAKGAGQDSAVEEAESHDMTWSCDTAGAAE